MNTQVGIHVKNKEKMNQLVYFDEIGKGSFRPCDIDSVLEVQGRYIIMFEIKEGDKEMPLGQKITYQNMTDALQRGGYKEAITIIVEHSLPDPSQPIMLKDCICRSKYQNGKWQNSKLRYTVKEFVQTYANKHNIKKLQ